MKIALVIEKMDLHRGGRERSVAEIAAELARRGHGVTILCQEGSLDIAGVEVLALGRSGLGRASRFKKFVDAVRQVVDREGYDIVHATLPVPAANVYQPRGGTVAGQLTNKAGRLCPLGRIIRRAFNFKRQCELKMEKQIAADESIMCLGVSQMVVEEFATHYNRRQNVRLVYSGVDVPQVDEETRESWRVKWRQRWSAADDTVVFVIAAHNFLLKGVPEATEAFAKYAKLHPARDARLVIVGGDDPWACRSLADYNGVGERVVFEKPAANIFEIYSAADAVVLLSWQDACSRVILEAIRWSVPSLTTRFNGAAELLARGAGVVVESPRDLPGIVAGMEKLSDHKKHLEMSNACRKAADFAGMKRQVDDLEKVYKEIAG